MKTAIYAIVRLTFTHWHTGSQLKVSGASVLPVRRGSHASCSLAPDVAVHDIEETIQIFWNDHPFHHANALVRKVCYDNTSNRLIQIKENDVSSFSHLYVRDGSSSLGATPDTRYNGNVTIRKSRKKQSFCLVLAYSGHHFCGWQRQRQPQNLKLPSVQEVVETAIEHAFVANGRPDVRVSGRTDAGVHAVGQVARVRILAQHVVNDTMTVVTTDNVRDALNIAALGSNYTWRCLSVVAVADKFHPTFDSRSRSYVYVLDAKAVLELICSIHSTGLNCDTEAGQYHALVQFQNILNSQLNCLVGKELDYFALSYGRVKTESTLCCLEHAKVVIGTDTEPQTNDQMMLLFEFTGNRFLRRMVRMLVGTCLYHSFLRLANHNTPLIMLEDQHDETLIDICNSRERTSLVKSF